MWCCHLFLHFLARLVWNCGDSILPEVPTSGNGFQRGHDIVVFAPQESLCGAGGSANNSLKAMIRLIAKSAADT